MLTFPGTPPADNVLCAGLFIKIRSPTIRLMSLAVAMAVSYDVRLMEKKSMDQTEVPGGGTFRRRMNVLRLLFSRSTWACSASALFCSGMRSS
jgi:hypothetical protein